MGAKRTQYQIIARVMNGKEVTGYMAINDKGQKNAYTKEQMCYLVGRDQVTNATGQIYQDKIVISGKGCELASLPVIPDARAELNKDKKDNEEVKTRKVLSNRYIMDSVHNIIDIMNKKSNETGLTASLNMNDDKQKVIQLTSEMSENKFIEIYITEDDILYAAWKNNLDKPFEERKISLNNEYDIYRVLELAKLSLLESTPVTKISLKLKGMILKLGKGQVKVKLRAGDDIIGGIETLIEPSKIISNKKIAIFIHRNELRFAKVNLWENNNIKTDTIIDLDNKKSIQNILNESINWLLTSNKNIADNIKHDKVVSVTQKKLLNKAKKLANILDKLSNNRFNITIDTPEENYCNLELLSKKDGYYWIEIFVNEGTEIDIQLMNDKTDNVPIEHMNLLVNNTNNIKDFLTKAYSWCYFGVDTFDNQDKTNEIVRVYIEEDEKGDFVRCKDCGELMLIQLGGTACGECESENIEWANNKLKHCNIEDLRNLGYIIEEV